MGVAAWALERLSRLRAAVEADDRLAAYRDRITTASGPDKRGRAQTIAGFAPADPSCHSP